MTKILGVAGSMRRESYSTRLLEMTLDQARILGADTRLVKLTDAGLPIFNPDVKRGREWERVQLDVLWADAILIATPDYHGSAPGAVRNFMDYFWKEFTGRLFGYIVASHEKGLTVQDQLRTTIRQCYGWSMPYGIGFNGDAVFSKDGALIDNRLGERVEMLARDLTIYGRLIHHQFESDIARFPREAGFAKSFKM